MHKLLRAGILIAFGMLIIGIIGGCGEDDPLEEVVDPPQQKDDVGPPRATMVVVDPPPEVDSTPTNTEFTLSFNQEVVEVTVNDIPAVDSGMVWKVSLPLEVGPGQVLNIKWVNQDGSTDTIKVGPYLILDVHDEPPVITSGTVADGDADVDPAPINAGGFRFDFDEDVTGTIKLTDEAGVDLNWIGTVAGQTATLTAVAGQELVHDTTYKIEIDVQDGAGNATRMTITFVTKPK